MKKILFLLFIAFVSCSSNKGRVETILFDCIEKIEDENGIILKTHFTNYEQLLLNKKILKNSSASAYEELLVRFSKKERVEMQIYPEDSLYVKVYNNRFADRTFQKIFACYSSLKKIFSEYDNQTLNLLEKTIYKFDKTEQLDNSKIAKEFSKILEKDDFELDFYKGIVLELVISYNSPPL